MHVPRGNKLKPHRKGSCGGPGLEERPAENWKHRQWRKKEAILGGFTCSGKEHGSDRHLGQGAFR
jgi:hypothetical protein